jgi:hypothetical protein
MLGPNNTFVGISLPSLYKQLVSLMDTSLPPNCTVTGFAFKSNVNAAGAAKVESDGASICAKAARSSIGGPVTIIKANTTSSMSMRYKMLSCRAALGDIMMGD